MYVGFFFFGFVRVRLIVVTVSGYYYFFFWLFGFYWRIVIGFLDFFRVNRRVGLGCSFGEGEVRFF